jgi:hypothetical protein
MNLHPQAPRAINSQASLLGTLQALSNPPNGALLTSALQLRTALVVIVERVELLYQARAGENTSQLLNLAQLKQLHTLAIAMLCQLANGSIPGLGDRLEACLFPDDLCGMPTLVDATDGGSDLAPTVPSEFDALPAAAAANDSQGH